MFNFKKDNVFNFSEKDINELQVEISTNLELAKSESMNINEIEAIEELERLAVARKIEGVKI